MSEQINGLFDSNLPVISPSLTDRILGENASQTGALTLQAVKNLVRGTVSKTRAEMLSLISSSGLVVGERYYISDKGLVADAVATNAISSHVILLSDPSSIYYYDISNDVLGTGIKLSGWGEPKGGFLFDGVNDIVNIPSNNIFAFGQNNFSVSVSIKTNSTVPSSIQIIATNFINTSIPYWAVYLQTNGKIRVTFYEGSGSERICDGLANICDGKQHYVVATYNRSGNLILFVDSMQNNTLDISPYSSVVMPNSAIRYGGTASNFYNAIIYSVRLFNRALSQAEVILLYNNGLTGQNALPFADVGANNTEINGDVGFDNDSYWTKSGLVTINSGGNSKAILTADGTLSNYFLRTLSTGLSYGKKLRISYTITSNTLVGSGSINLSFISGNSIATGTIPITVGSHVVEVNTNTTGSRTVFGIILVATFTSGSIEFENLSIIPIGCVAEYLPENAGDYSWYDSSGNRLHGEVVSTAGAGGASPLFRQLIQKATTGNFTTNIASGVASKVIYCPPGYSINSIAVRNTLASGNITDFQAVMAGVNLVTGKTINNAKSVIFKSIADHEISTSPQAITFTATGNGTGGIEISVAFFRRD